MPLTPIDIQQKTFGPELRGYNMDEVDDFLDEVVTALKDYDQRVRDAQDRIRALEAELSTRGEDESAISRALVAAQKQADTLTSDAQADAERIRGDAQVEADELRTNRETERMTLTQDIARMRATVADLKRRVVELAASAGEDLDAMDQEAASASAAIGSDFGATPTADEAIESATAMEPAAARPTTPGFEEAAIGDGLDAFGSPSDDDEGVDDDDALVTDDWGTVDEADTDEDEDEVEVEDEDENEVEDEEEV
ncbi:MAG: DivIVA domain-containing protein, partial [Acidimicrobiia bacterium]